MKTKSFLATAISASGVTVLIQGLAFLRQLLIAAYFGVSRELDIYVMSYALATIIVFTFSMTFDSAIVPRLVKAHVANGEEAARALAASLFRWSCGLGVAVTALLIALTPLLAPIVATGFDPRYRVELTDFVWSFAPWTFLSLPYYAAAARHKAMRSFNRVFGAEIVVCVVSIIALIPFHSGIEDIPWAYSAGYAVALLWLLPKTGLVERFRQSSAPGTGEALHGVGRLYLANQTASAASVVDRHFQSLVPAGGIAAVNYSTQIVNGLMGLLTFREIYVVSLSEIERRSDKLERLIVGLLILSMPLAAFTATMAPEIVQTLFERGRFNADATLVTASILRIAAFGIIPLAISNPILRTLQIVDRIALMHVVYLSNVLFLILFGILFVGYLGLGVQGLAWMLLLNGIGSCCVAAFLLSRCGIGLRWTRIIRYLLFLAAASGVAAISARVVVSPFDHAWSRLIASVLAYGLVIGSMYFLIRSRLRIISGQSRSDH